MFAPEKAVDAISYMAHQVSNLSIHAALKACYFADKSHLNAHHQPIFGATYKAMKYGPVPLEIYEIIKGEQLWMEEIGIPGTPWDLNGYNISPRHPAPQSMDRFADSELRHLDEGIALSSKLNFNARTAATHGPDWQAAAGGTMKYEDMLENGPDKVAIAQYINETSRRTRL